MPAARDEEFLWRALDAAVRTGARRGNCTSRAPFVQTPLVGEPERTTP
jgi:hypothetical protein